MSWIIMLSSFLRSLSFLSSSLCLRSSPFWKSSSFLSSSFLRSSSIWGRLHFMVVFILRSSSFCNGTYSFHHLPTWSRGCLMWVLKNLLHTYVRTYIQSDSYSEVPPVALAKKLTRKLFWIKKILDSYNLIKISIRGYKLSSVF